MSNNSQELARFAGLNPRSRRMPPPVRRYFVLLKKKTLKSTVDPNILYYSGVFGKVPVYKLFEK